MCHEAGRGYSCFAEWELDDVRSQISPSNKMKYSRYSSFQNGNLKVFVLVFGFMSALFFAFKPLFKDALRQFSVQTQNFLSHDRSDHVKAPG